MVVAPRKDPTVDVSLKFLPDSGDPQLPYPTRLRYPWSTVLYLLYLDAFKSTITQSLTYSSTYTYSYLPYSKSTVLQLIEQSIRTLLAAPRDRSLHLTLRIRSGALSTSLQAVDEEEILDKVYGRADRELTVWLR